MSRHIRKALFAAVTIAVLALLAGAVSAKGKPDKPGKPPGGEPQDPSPDTGVIYFEYSGDGNIWSMAYDGSNKQALSIDRRVNVDASELTHSGERWFLTAQPVDAPPYPNGAERWEIFAISASGSTVQLTDNPEVEILGVSLEGSNVQDLGGWPQWMVVHSAEPRWCCDDTKVSYWARRWENGGLVEGSEGLYEAEVDWSSRDTEPTKLDVNLQPYSGLLGGYFYDWSPDGERIVYEDAGAIFVLDVGPDAQPCKIASGSGAEWSPVPGTDRIVFLSGDDLYSVAPNGSDQTLIVSRSDNRKEGLYGAAWSPNATHVAYSVRKNRGQLHVYRANAQGEYETNLTEDLVTKDTQAFVIGWRAD